MTKREKLDFCRKWIAKLNGDYSQLNADRETALKFINSDPSIVDLIKGRSQIVTTDMQDAIDMAKPDILESIAGNDDPLHLEPTGSEDVEPVKRLEILGNIMIKRKNPWFRRCSDFLDDSMKLKLGVFKYQWVEDIKTIEKEYKDLTDEELLALLEAPSASLVVQQGDKGKDGKPIPRTIIAYTQTDEYVRIDTVPAERIKFPLDTKDFENAAIVIEEVRFYRHEFIKQYGKEAFKKIEEEYKAVGANTELEEAGITEQRFKDVGGASFIYDKESDKYKAWECYFWEEDEEKPWIFCFAGDEVLIDEANKYGKPPYRGGSPFLLAHRLLGNGYFDLLKEIQRQRTFFKRQIFDNVTQANYRRYFGDPDRLNLDDYLNNNATNALIRVQGDPSTAVMAEEKAPLPREVLEFWELLNVEKDYHTPTPRAFTGVNPKVINRTYRGQAQQIGQASKKLLMMIRAYMEDVFGPLFSDVLDCIMKFMKRSTSIRYLNRDYDITPDNIVGRYDMAVNVGLGAHDKNDVIVKLQQLIGLMYQAMAVAPGVIIPQNIHYVFQELVKAMGFLNTTDFVTDPRIRELVTQFTETVTAMLQEVAATPGLQGVAEYIGQLLPMAQQLMAALGMAPQAQARGGENPKGTFPGQEPAAIPEQAVNSVFPRMTPDGGGGFYA